MPTSGSQWLTFWFVVAMTATAIGYDVLAIHLWGVDASISRVMRRLHTAYPSLMLALAFWMGIYIGHTFLDAQRSPVEPPAAAEPE